MGLSEEQKEIKKELAGYKRKITEVAGMIHDIVENTIWSDYDKLPILSEQIQVQMKEMLAFKDKYDFLK